MVKTMNHMALMFIISIAILYISITKEKENRFYYCCSVRYLCSQIYVVCSTSRKWNAWQQKTELNRTEKISERNQTSNRIREIMEYVRRQHKEDVHMIFLMYHFHISLNHSLILREKTKWFTPLEFSITTLLTSRSFEFA